jgi:hypothetical protein
MKKFLVLLLLSVFLVSGCSVPFHKKLDTYLSYGQYTDALALIDEEKTKNKENIYRDKNELLYFFDKGRGIFVEVLKDVTFYLAPITEGEAVQMLKSTNFLQRLLPTKRILSYQTI